MPVKYCAGSQLRAVVPEEVLGGEEVKISFANMNNLLKLCASYGKKVLA